MIGDKRGQLEDPICHIMILDEVERAEIAALLKREENYFAPCSWSGVALIRNIRVRAFQIFENERREHYFVHALVFLLLMFRMAEVTAEAQERLAALFIACCEELKDRSGTIVKDY